MNFFLEKLLKLNVAYEARIIILNELMFSLRNSETIKKDNKMYKKLELV
jgi:hypothetical protein